MSKFTLLSDKIYIYTVNVCTRYLIICEKYGTISKRDRISSARKTDDIGKEEK